MFDPDPYSRDVNALFTSLVDDFALIAEKRADEIFIVCRDDTIACSLIMSALAHVAGATAITLTSEPEVLRELTSVYAETCQKVTEKLSAEGLAAPLSGEVDHV